MDFLIGVICRLLLTNIQELAFVLLSTVRCLPGSTICLTKADPRKSGGRYDHVLYYVLYHECYIVGS